MNWSHSTLGQFDITEQWIGLDYRRLFLDPIRAEVTAFHEVTHSIISKTTEMGQATQNIFFFSQWFQHMDAKQVTAIQSSLVASQKFPQEGFATFMEMQQLRTKASAEIAEAAKSDMHPEYLERFEKMEFMYQQPKKFRGNFTKKISRLVMENGLRKNTPLLGLLESPEALKAYLDHPDNNPGIRLDRVLECLRKNPRLVQEKPRKIARACGIKFHEPATKQQVSDFINYLLRLCSKQEDYTPEMVGLDPGPETISEAFENLLITNVNFDLKDTAETLMRAEDIEYEASYAKAVFIVHHTPTEDTELEKYLGRKLEFDLLMFDKSGTKYLTITSGEHLDKLLANELKDATIVTKWGITNAAANTFDASKVRNPDIIQYNRPIDMLATFKSTNGITKYEWVHLGAAQDHPFHSLLVKTNGSPTIHFVTGFGNSGIASVIEFMEAKGDDAISPNDLLPHADAINDMLSILGLPWDVDWIRTMISKNELIRR